MTIKTSRFEFIKNLFSIFHPNKIKSCSTTNNPYRYDIDKYLETPPELILYKETTQLKLPIENPSSIAIDKSDKLYVTGNNFLLIYHNNKLINKIKLDDKPESIAVDNSHNIYLAMKNHISVMDSNGNIKKTFPSLGENAFLISITINNNNIFVSDFGQKLIWHFDTSGKLINRIGKYKDNEGIDNFIIPSPFFDILLNDSNELYVANTGKHLIEKYNIEGRRLNYWGKASMAPEGFAGCCNPTYFTLTGEGHFITSEKGIPRVKIYDSKGNFKGFVAGAQSFDQNTIGLEIVCDKKDNVIVLDPERKMIRFFKKNK